MKKRSVAVTAAVMCGAAALIGIGAGPAAAATTTLFSSTTPGVVNPAPVVPAGVCAVTITADGGHGGGAAAHPATGGAAALVGARVAVAPGTTLNVLVGGAGGTGFDGDGVTTFSYGGAGGIGGGGGGSTAAGGGGGVSVVWTPAPAPLVVAGGGGGGNGGSQVGGAAGPLGQDAEHGHNNHFDSGVPTGGKADGTGGNGGVDSVDVYGNGGGGGGVGAGGQGGVNGKPGADGRDGGSGNGVAGGGGGSGLLANAPGGNDGGNVPGTGAAGTGTASGSNGGAGTAPGGAGGSTTAPSTGAGGGGGIGFGGGGGAGGSNGAGGGGGAGYGGGGGGGVDSFGSGGGGSSYATPSALNTSSALSTRTGDGQVTITYDPVADACPTFQPDVMARRGNVAAFTDVNAYSLAYTASSTVKSGKAVTFVLRVFNDGNVSQMINLKAALTGNSRLYYQFKDGATALSNMTTSGRSYTLAPGAFKQLTVTVTATAGTPLNANRTATLTARSVTQPTKVDEVKIKVTRT